MKASRVVALLALVGLGFVWHGVSEEGTTQDKKSGHGKFTGQVKPVLYVKDVQASAAFYRDTLGFDFLGFANINGSPYYADMRAGSLKFGLHEPQNAADERRVGKQRLYFRVENLADHRARVEAWGATPGRVHETAWMNMFTVVDQDGHEIVFAVTEEGTHTIDPW